MKLTDYLKAKNLSEAEFARSIGADSRTSVNRYCSGDRIPNREAMLKIAEVTEGQVTANDFYGIDPAPASEAAA